MIRNKKLAKRQDGALRIDYSDLIVEQLENVEVIGIKNKSAGVPDSIKFILERLDELLLVKSVMAIHNPLFPLPLISNNFEPTKHDQLVCQI